MFSGNFSARLCKTQQQQRHRSVVGCNHYADIAAHCHLLEVKELQTVMHCWWAWQVTALGQPKLLERVSDSLVSVHNLFRRFDEDLNGVVTRDEFEKVLVLLW